MLKSSRKFSIMLLIFLLINNLSAQNQAVSGANTAIVNGHYIYTGTLNSANYYVKVGTPTLYLYQWIWPGNNCIWMIDETLGTDPLATIYYFAPGDPARCGALNGGAPPEGLTLSMTGGQGILPGPTLNDTPLPVELSLFSAENILEGVLCQWTTESEIENLGFVLERKTEGTDWEEIVSYKSDRNLMGQGTISSPTDYEYLDKLVEPNTTYDYRLADVDLNGAVTYHSTRTVTVEQAALTSMVEEFTVLPAYPNPFNPSTTIKYVLGNDSKVTVAIYDIAGKLITTLVNTEQTQGWHSVIWNGTNQLGEQAPAGQYLSRVISDNEVKTTKLLLLK